MKMMMGLQRLMLALTLLVSAVSVQAAGSFRFVTTSVPDGTTNAEYFAKLMTANAAGPVTFSVKTGCGAQCETLPTGLVLNAQTGTISGSPIKVEAKNVTIVATDGTNTIELYLNKFQMTAQSGGGNSGAKFANDSLASGRVGVAYSVTIAPSGGVGPFTYGAQNLPTGLSLNGTTGAVTGTPIVAGTFYVTFTMNDAGENNRVITTLPLTVYPADATDPATYNFAFTTYMLNNGEVGTAFSDSYATSGAKGTVSYSATSLPAGLTLNQSTGVVSGTPTVAGTFYVTILATDQATGVTISTNLAMWILPSSTSHFYWSYFGVPAAIYGEAYDRQPPILVSALNGTSVTYSVLGLPPGLSYNSSTGELTGTPSEVGLFPVTFTATDSSNAQTLTLPVDFVVLPPGGGDVGRLAVNLWTKSLKAKVVSNTNPSDTNDSWTASYIYNADRRTGKIFDPATQDFYLALGNSTVLLPAGSFKINSKSGVFTYASPKGAPLPKLSINGNSSKQTLTVKVTGSEIGATMPADPMDNSVILGSKGFKLKEALDETGKFKPTFAYRNASLVVQSAKLKVKGSTLDNLVIKLGYADPSFQFAEGTLLNVKLYDGTNVLLDKDLTSLVGVTTTTDKLSHTIYNVKKLKTADAATQNVLSAFSYNSSKGLLSLSLKKLVLAASLPSGQAHLGLQLTVGDMSYFTSITLFETAVGSKQYAGTISSAYKPFP